MYIKFQEVRMATRRYVSSVRAAAAAETRKQVMEAARRLLREQSNFAAFSLDSVAREAGVTRLTVYNQFGSRRGLLEVLFDDLAEKGGLDRIPEAMAIADPREALDHLITIFCRFWGGDPAIGRLNEAVAVDLEFGETVSARNERRRKAIETLATRVSAGKGIGGDRLRDAVDLIFGLTSYAMFKTLVSKRSPEAASVLIRKACAGVLDGILVSG
jgi:AcrR family transcriptional regulator